MVPSHAYCQKVACKHHMKMSRNTAKVCCTALSPLHCFPPQQSIALQRWRRRKDENRRQTLQQQTLFTHKANPMFDTTQTLTTTSSSARGDDFEVIRVPPGQPPIQETPHLDPTGYMPPLFTVSCVQAIKTHNCPGQYSSRHCPC